MQQGGTPETREQDPGPVQGDGARQAQEVTVHASVYSLVFIIFFCIRLLVIQLFRKLMIQTDI